MSSNDGTFSKVVPDHDDDASFINDEDESTQASSAHKTPTASQDLAGLDPPSSLPAGRLIRPPPGAFAERKADEDDDEYTEEEDEYGDTVRILRPKNTALPPSAHNTPPPDAAPASRSDAPGSRTSAAVAAPTAPNGATSSCNPAPPTAGPTPGDAATVAALGGVTSSTHVQAIAKATRATAPAPAATPGTESPAPASSALTTPSTSALPNLLVGHYLDALSIQRIDKQGHPTYRWSNIFEAADSRPYPPVGTIRFKLAQGFNINLPHHEFIARQALLEGIAALIKAAPDLKGPRSFSITFSTGRFKHVDISCGTDLLLQVLRSLSVRIEGLDEIPTFVLENPTVGAALGARYMPFRVRAPGCAPSVALQHLTEALHNEPNVFAVETWAVYHHSGPPPAVAVPTNVLVALLVIRPPPGADFSTPLTASDLLSIPAFIDGNPTCFPGRPRWCRTCKEDAQLQKRFHTNEDCANFTIRFCAVCADTSGDHTGSSCPKHPRNRGAGYPSTEEDAFEYVGSKTHSLAPTGPAGTTATPAPRPSTSSSVVPVATHDNPTRTRGRGRGRGRGQAPGASGSSPRSAFQTFIGPGGILSRDPPPGPPPSESDGSPRGTKRPYRGNGKECNTASSSFSDTKGAQDALRISTPPPFRAMLAPDAAILIRDPSLHIVSSATGSRWAVVHLRADAPLFGSAREAVIWSIHGPFSSSEWIPIGEAIRSHPSPLNVPTFFGADWNSVPDPLLDSLSGTPTGVPWAAPAAALAPLDVVDFFRALRPADRSWTYARTSTLQDGSTRTSARRLDSVWGSTFALPHVAHCVSVSTSSDHRAVGVTFCAPQSSDASEPLPRYRAWSLHPGLWNEPEFCSALSSFAEHYRPLTDLDSRSALTDWRQFHGDLRDFLRPLARSAGTSQRLARDDLDSARSELDSLDMGQPGAAERLRSLLRRWHDAQTATHSASSLNAAGTPTASALRTSSWLFCSYDSAASRRLPPLLHPDGLVSSPQAQLKLIRDFFAELYTARSPPPGSASASAQLLSVIRLRLSAAQSASIAAPFTLDEVYEALSGANRRSSSGPDGVPYRVYLATFPASGPRLQALANSLGSGHPWPVSARTILLPKSGDPAVLSNYRPITITDAYVRTVSRLVTARLILISAPWATHHSAPLQ
ncbi:hypothetical protein OC835_006251 [Tilletia horrida]|nr:hypothetical protein OC835_006251 [Tilletia horrida]